VWLRSDVSPRALAQAVLIDRSIGGLDQVRLTGLSRHSTPKRVSLLPSTGGLRSTPSLPRPDQSQRWVNVEQTGHGTDTAHVLAGLPRRATVSALGSGHSANSELARRRSSFAGHLNLPSQRAGGRGPSLTRRPQHSGHRTASAACLGAGVIDSIPVPACPFADKPSAPTPPDGAFAWPCEMAKAA
jgi:hypothetical protein